ncbi:phosphotransferase [Bacillus sp. ISL-35]|uniref:phosphotransferase enzyme family protein n=1 Tax=Bacillus sp. ISL-35 TaxID=2819122 RepID=UPI001BE86C79|nr:phosphotransferase [Bacillus sp. ISL-35]MBT2703248.1 phosphotransferase [Chryseobacterium sp. ISL-80]
MSEKIRLIGGFHNEVYYLKDENKILRISEVNKTEQSILQELEWMEFLQKNGIRIPLPEKKLRNYNGRITTFFEYIEGNPVEVKNQGFWNSKTFEKLGRILGKMHALSKNFEVAEIHRPVWTKDKPDVFSIKSNLDPGLKRIYDDLMGKLLFDPVAVDTYGLIHNDFHQGNLIVTNQGDIVVIDFDECSYNWFAQDVAVFFYHAYWQQQSFNGMTDDFCQEFLHSFFAGYQAENLLHEITIKQIPIFLKLREIYLYQLFLQKWDLDQLEEWQKFTLDNLKNVIKNQMPYAGILDFSVYL